MGMNGQEQRQHKSRMDAITAATSYAVGTLERRIGDTREDVTVLGQRIDGELATLQANAETWQRTIAAAIAAEVDARRKDTDGIRATLAREVDLLQPGAGFWARLRWLFTGRRPHDLKWPDERRW